jgi:trk system potassium uptake protein
MRTEAKSAGYSLPYADKQLQMFQAFLRILGLLLAVIGAALVPPAMISYIYGDGYHVFYLWAVGIGMCLGGAGMFLTPRVERTLRTRDGFLIVALAWLIVTVLGSVPFIMVGGFDWVTAIFESASGFTTTGATAIIGLEKLPLSLLFFRQEIQWLGGIGVIVAAIALLPMLGIGGMQLLKAETTGPAKSDKLRPRIRHTARAMWRLYMLLTVGCALGYWFAGMPAFDAVAHSFTTVSTGGFSIHDASLAHYASPAIEAVAVVFMMLGAINFAVHFRAWTYLDVRPYLSNPEVRAFVATVLGLTVLVAAVLFAQTDTTATRALRYAVFEVVSVITSTGYGIDDFSAWPGALPVLLIFVSFIGGCAGSTAGGMKVIRFLVMSRQAVIEVTRLIHPKLMRPLKIGGAVVDDTVVRAVWAFFTIYALVFVVLMLSLMAAGVDQVTAFAAVATCINNLGPGLGDVATHFAGASDTVKLISAFACILGRLEVLTIFVLFTPGYWRA